MGHFWDRGRHGCMLSWVSHDNRNHSKRQVCSLSSEHHHQIIIQTILLNAVTHFMFSNFYLNRGPAPCADSEQTVQCVNGQPCVLPVSVVHKTNLSHKLHPTALQHLVTVLGWEVSKDVTLHCVTLVHVIVVDFVCLRCYSNVVWIHLWSGHHIFLQYCQHPQRYEPAAVTYQLGTKNHFVAFHKQGADKGWHFYDGLVELANPGKGDVDIPDTLMKKKLQAKPKVSHIVMVRVSVDITHFSIQFSFVHEISADNNNIHVFWFTNKKLKLITAITNSIYQTYLSFTFRWESFMEKFGDSPLTYSNNKKLFVFLLL